MQSLDRLPCVAGALLRGDMYSSMLESSVAVPVDDRLTDGDRTDCQTTVKLPSPIFYLPKVVP